MLHVFKALVRNMVQSTTHPGIGLTNPFVGFEVYTPGMGLRNPIVGFKLDTLGMGLTNPIVGFEVYTLRMGLTSPIVGVKLYILGMGLTNPIVGFKLYTLGWAISKSKPLDSKITHSLRSLSRLCTRDRNSCRLIEYYWDDVHYGLCFSCIPLKVDGNLCVPFYEEHTWGGKRTPLNHSLLCTKLVFGKRNVGDKHPSHVRCM
jgi:hypothetical protein